MTRTIKQKAVFALLLSFITITVTICTAAADSIYETAYPLVLRQKMTSVLSCGEVEDYQVEVDFKGTLKLNLTADIGKLDITVYDSDGNEVKVANYEVKSGEKYDYQGGGIGQKHIRFEWNETVEKLNAEVTYSVTPGTYYIRFDHLDKWGCDGNIEFTVTPVPVSKKTKISLLTLEIPIGGNVQLGTVLSPTDSTETVSWTSLKTAIATVSSTGKVTAKTKGSTTITAKCGTSKVRIKIKVV